MIKVICAILEQYDRVLVTQRSDKMQEPLLWEFPGGKLETGETEVECLIREVKEELSLDIQPLQRLTPVRYTTSNGPIELIPYICKYHHGAISLLEHNAYQWAHYPDLSQYNWCPADVPIVEEFLQLKGH